MRVVILSQGQQSRLGDPKLVGYKQLLPLQACAGAPILLRTYRQLMARPDSFDVVLVAWPEILAGLAGSPMQRDPFIEYRNHLVTLAVPGNSSLRGIHRYLHSSIGSRDREDTIVLLGDVVYSWACLDALFAMAKVGGFVGTSDLSGDAGELWGVAWPGRLSQYMFRELEDALLFHPPFDEYQCGQMRRWVSGFRTGSLVGEVARRRRDGSYLDIDDYTRDIDTRAQLALLPELSTRAAADDEAHGLLWRHPGSQEVD